MSDKTSKKRKAADTESDSPVKSKSKGDGGLSQGDIVRFDRGWYWHYAIYSGNGKVIHRAVPGVKNIFNHALLNSAVVREDKLEDLMKNDDYKEYKCDNYLDDETKPLPKEEIVSRASSKLGKKTYDLMTNNCEHFATWCRYKKQVSRQADAITKSEGAIYEMLRKMIKTEKN